MTQLDINRLSALIQQLIELPSDVEAARQAASIGVEAQTILMQQAGSHPVAVAAIAPTITCGECNAPLHLLEAVHYHHAAEIYDAESWGEFGAGHLIKSMGDDGERKVVCSRDGAHNTGYEYEATDELIVAVINEVEREIEVGCHQCGNDLTVRTSLSNINGTNFTIPQRKSITCDSCDYHHAAGDTFLIRAIE